MAEITDEEYVSQHPEHRELDPAIRAQLRQNAQLQADLDTERASRTQLERRNQFMEAGVTGLPGFELIEKTYEGEMTKEAITEYAARFGLVPNADTASQQQVEDRTDLDAIRRTQQASNGAPTGAPLDFGDALDRVQSLQEWNAVMRNAPPESRVKLQGTVAGNRLV